MASELHEYRCAILGLNQSGHYGHLPRVHVHSISRSASASTAAQEVNLAAIAPSASA